MLWYKAWLETRWRVVFIIASALLCPLTLSTSGAPPSRLWLGFEVLSSSICCFAALYLAGSGVNTQTTYSAKTGFHPSMLFTLSLPVSRRRLLSARAALGAVETCIFVVAVTGLALFWAPGPVSTPEVLRYEARAIVCTMAVYALSTLLACFLDEMWQFSGVCLLLVAVWQLQSRIALVAQLSPLRGMSLISYPLAAPMPWAPVLTALAITAMLLCASVLVLQRKEY